MTTPDTNGTTSPRLRRWPRWKRLAVLGSALAAGTVLLLVAGGAWLWSAGGERFLRAQVEAVAAEQIAGRVEVDALRLGSFFRLDLQGFRLHAPGDSAPVVSVDAIRCHLRLRDLLLARTLRVEAFEIVAPRVAIVTAADGTTNLDRALAPRKTPPPPAPPSEPPLIVIEAPLIQLIDGTVDLKPVEGAPIHVDDLTFSGRIAGTLREPVVDADLRAHLRTPLDRALHVRTRAQVSSHQIRVESLDIDAGGSHLHLTAEAARDGSQGTVRVTPLSVAANEVQAFVPEWPAGLPLRAEAEAQLRPGEASARVSVPVGDGAVRLRGTAALSNLLEPITFSASLEVSDVVPSTWMPSLPPARVQGRIDVDGRGATPDTLDARVRMDFSGSTYGRLPLAVVRAAATVQKQIVHLESLDMEAAGMVARVHGDASATALHLNWKAKLADLTRTATALRDGLEIEAGRLSGALTLGGQVTGSPDAPAGTLDVESKSMEVDGTAVRGFTAHGVLGALRPQPTGAFELAVDSVSSAGHLVDSLRGRGTLDGRRADLRLTGRLDRTSLAARIDASREKKVTGAESDVQSWRLHALEAEALGVRVHTPAGSDPARVALFPSGEVRLEGLSLDGNLGRIRLDARQVPGPPERLSARLEVDGLALEKLPPSVFPPELKAGGRVSLRARVEGPSAAPVIDADLAWAEGRGMGLADLGLTGHAHVTPQRARVEAQMSLPHTGLLRLEADVPPTAPAEAMKHPALAEVPVDIRVTVSDLDLALAQALDPTQAPLQGRLGLEMALGGSWRDPQLDLAANMQDVAASGATAMDVDLHYTHRGESGTVGMKIRRQQDMSIDVDGTVGLPLSPALAGESVDAMRIPVAMRVAIAQLRTAWLAQAGLAPSDVAGDWAGHIDITGTGQDPTVDLRLRGSEVAAAGFAGLTAHVDVQGVAAEQRTAIGWDLRRGQLPFAHGTLQLPLAPGPLGRLTPTEQRALPLRMEAALDPTPLSVLQPPPPGPRATEVGAQAEAAEAQVQGIFRLEGPATAPLWTFSGQAMDIRLGAKKLGMASIDARQEPARTPAITWRGAVETAGAGQLRFEGTRTAAVDLPAWEAGGSDALMAAPITFSLDSQDFDLGLANGLVSGARNIGGRMDLHLMAEGAPSAPRVAGTLALREARAALPDLGRFDGVEMQAQFTEHGIDVSRLAGRSGSGRFSGRLGAELPRDGIAGKASFALDLDQVPLVQNGQTRALVSMRLEADGTAEDHIVRIPAFRILKGRVRIPESLPKSVQSLEPHPDVVFSDSDLDAQAPVRDQDAIVSKKSGSTPSTVPSAEEPWRALVGIQMRDFEIKAPLDSTLVLRADLQADWNPARATTGADPLSLTGRVDIDRGVLNLIRRFEIDQGKLEFYAGKPTDPALAIRAHHTSGDTEVAVEIGGTASTPTQTFTSRPAMEESEILYFLATGQRQQRAQTGAVGFDSQLTDATLSVVGTAFAGAIQGAVRKLLPAGASLDVLSVEADVQNRGLGRIRAGKYVNERLYVGGQYNPGADVQRFENTAEGELEYRVGQQQYLRLRLGESRSGVEFLWERQIPTAAQRRARVVTIPPTRPRTTTPPPR